MNNFMKVATFLNGLLLIRFSLSKLFAWPISVKAFIEMAKPLNIDPTFFRLFTGVIISTICIGYFVSFYFLIKKKVHSNTKELVYTAFFNLLGIGVMFGALASEFGLRVEPKWPLVYIASFIIFTSIINILTLKKLNISQSFMLFKDSSKINNQLK